MKRYLVMLMMVFSLKMAANASPEFEDVQTSLQKVGITPYKVNVISTGPDAIVQAIKQHSDITEADVNRWTFSWVPFVGSTIRDVKINKVKKFLAVCTDFPLANITYTSTENLVSALTWQNISSNYKEICSALKNLQDQASYASRLLNQVQDSSNNDIPVYRILLGKFTNNIGANINRMTDICSGVKVRKKSKMEVLRKEQLQQLDYNAAWWKMNAVRWKLAKDMGAQTFRGVKWLAQTVNENPAPFFTAAAMWYVYNKMLGTGKPVAK